MKKVIMIILSTLLVISAAGCGNGITGKKTDGVAQNNYTDAPRPLAMRNDIIKEIQAEYELLKSEFEKLENGNPKKDEIKKQMENNLKEQQEVFNGINGEENFGKLSKRLEEYAKLAQRYVDNGDTEKANELFEIMNVINYGNKEGEKTW